MQTLHQAGPDFEKLNQISKEMLARILPQVVSLRTECKIRGKQDLYAASENASRLYVIRDGLLRHERDGRLILLYDEGDLVGVEKLYFPTETRIYSEFPTLAYAYDSRAFLTQIAQNPEILAAWQQYLVVQSCLLNSILACALSKEATFPPQIVNYRAGDTILAEGGAGQEVCLLMEGKAEVWLKGQRIGEVLKDEIFGAFAVLTNQPRTATVKAAYACTVLVMPALHFQDLIKTRPQSVWALLQSMARIIVDLNQRVVKQSPP
jgi:CRP/FNR family transcriptional regulator, cyclic AMP receptor protein